MAIPIRSPDEIDAIARAGAVAWDAIGAARDAAVEGATTGSLDDVVRQRLASVGADPLFEGYRHGSGPAFGGVSCMSVNEQVTHGVPGDRRLEAGDLLTIDVGARVDGWCADAARSMIVGDEAAGDRGGGAARLLDVTERALAEALAAVGPGRRWVEVVSAAEQVVADGGFRLAAGYDGHGIGRELHEPPRAWLAWPDERETGADFVFRPGMVLTIEPIVLSGRGELLTMPDGWTVRTRDRKIACHEERTIAVTRHGRRVLTGGEGVEVGSERTRSGAV